MAAIQASLRREAQGGGRGSLTSPKAGTGYGLCMLAYRSPRLIAELPREVIYKRGHRLVLPCHAVATPQPTYVSTPSSFSFERGEDFIPYGIFSPPPALRVALYQHSERSAHGTGLSLARPSVWRSVRKVYCSKTADWIRNSGCRGVGRRWVY